MGDKHLSIRELVKIFLEVNGYDGLAGDECGCEVDGLMPCGNPEEDHCVAGHVVVDGIWRTVRPGKRPEKEADDDSGK